MATKVYKQTFSQKNIDQSNNTNSNSHDYPTYPKTYYRTPLGSNDVQSSEWRESSKPSHSTYLGHPKADISKKYQRNTSKVNEKPTEGHISSSKTVTDVNTNWHSDNETSPIYYDKRKAPRNDTTGSGYTASSDRRNAAYLSYHSTEASPKAGRRSIPRTNAKGSSDRRNVAYPTNHSTKASPNAGRRSKPRTNDPADKVPCVKPKENKKRSEATEVMSRKIMAADENKEERKQNNRLISDIVNRNPMQLLNEKFADLTFEVVSESGLAHNKYFKLSVCVNGTDYEGSGKNKKEAKCSIAQRVLLKELGIVCTNQAAKNETPFPEEQILDPKIANKIAEKICEKFTEVSADNDWLKKFKVLSGVVLTWGEYHQFVKVIALSTGTKTAQSNHLSTYGYCVKDGHAEILSRRCLVHYLYTHLEHLILGKELESKEECILEPIPNERGYRMKKKFNIHLYINTAPCGDARIFAPHDQNGDIQDNHPNRLNRGLLRSKIESGEGSLPIGAGTYYAMQTFTGLRAGERLRIMSCSDKICKWNILGLQGGILSHLLEPIYLYSIVLGSLLNKPHIYRALIGRIESIGICGDGPYYLHKPKIGLGKSVISKTRRRTTKMAVNWICDSKTPEIIEAVTGRVYMGLESRKVSRLCKSELVKRFILIIKTPGVRPLTDLKQNDFQNLSYRKLKQMSTSYMNARNEIYEAFSKAGLGNWIRKPESEEYFMSTHDCRSDCECRAER